MSARVLDFLGLRRGIASVVKEMLNADPMNPTVVTHWEDQRQPAPATGPYVSLAFRGGFNPTAVLEETRVSVVTSSTITVPAVLPAVGTWLMLFVDDWQPYPRHQVAGGDTPEIVRDSLLSQIQDLRPVKYGFYFSAAAQGTDEIVLTPNFSGGIGDVTQQGGLTVVNSTEDSYRAAGPATFVLRTQFFGTSGTSSADLSAVGFDHWQGLASTFAFKLQRRRWNDTFRDRAGVSFWALLTQGTSVPRILDAGVEPSETREYRCAVNMLDFDSLPPELVTIRGTLGTRDPGTGSTTSGTFST